MTDMAALGEMKTPDLVELAATEELEGFDPTCPQRRPVLIELFAARAAEEERRAAIEAEAEAASEFDGEPTSEPENTEVAPV